MLSIYKSFIRPHLDYADVIYDQPHNETFYNKIESVQYNAALSITGAIRGTSREKLYQELGLERLRDRRWYRRLVYFFNIVNRNSPAYLNNLLPTRQYSYNIDRSNLFSLYSVNSDYFKNSFFPFCVREWNKLVPEIRNLKSVSLFKKSILSFIRPNSFSVYNVHDPIGLKYLTRLRPNLSHLREHKFRHNFLDTVNPLCSCSLEMESVSHFLLRCPFFTNLRITLLDNLIDIIGDISNLPDSKQVNILLYGDSAYNIETNTFILKNTISFLKMSERFDIALL